MQVCRPTKLPVVRPNGIILAVGRQTPLATKSSFQFAHLQKAVVRTWWSSSLMQVQVGFLNSACTQFFFYSSHGILAPLVPKLMLCTQCRLLLFTYMALAILGRGSSCTSKYLRLPRWHKAADSPLKFYVSDRREPWNGLRRPDLFFNFLRAFLWWKRVSGSSCWHYWPNGNWRC